MQVIQILLVETSICLLAHIFDSMKIKRTKSQFGAMLDKLSLAYHLLFSVVYLFSAKCTKKKAMYNYILSIIHIDFFEKKYNRLFDMRISLISL